MPSDCVAMAANPVITETHREFQLIAVAAECILAFSRYPTIPSETGTTTEVQNFEIRVFPTREPQHEGMLVDIDNTD
jgi:hypothetical protein